MTDPRVEAMAKVLVGYSLAVKEGDLVRIQGGAEGSPLLLAIYEQVLGHGGHPWVQVGLEGSDEAFYTRAADPQLDYVPRFAKEIIEEIKASISVWTETNTKRLTGVDPAKQARRAQATRPLSDRFLERAAQRDLRWTVTLYPTHAFAQDAEMSLRDFARFVFKACLVEEADPIAAWQTISQSQKALVEWLGPRKEIRVTGPDTDLRLKVEGRTWVNCDGHENFPDGEIFTGPIEDSVMGHIRFTYPACIYGREVEDVRLEFKQGKVVKATAGKNEPFLLKMLDTDEGARQVGEFAFGTNHGIQRFTKNSLFDEKIGGTIHLALGKGYPESGSKSQSAIHWDMVCDLRQGGEVRVDGIPFMRDGKYLV
ncbi:TPA: aminopeptidase [Candidatus Acetothermia bacterium]|nr:aminopeptidase [Candidatus Acetothermia bacterium]HAZ30838.1 aminopeptidase [Candidatus Acetothermia bacterium]